MNPTPSTTPPAQPVVSLRGLSKTFYTDEIETHVLQGIDLDVPPGDFLSIAGPSGCGKSTLLSILGLLDVPSSGDYLLNGRSVGALKANERAHVRNQEIGFIFQSFNLIGELNVNENVELPLLYGNHSTSERKQRIEAALAKVDMSHRAKHYPNQLSGGQQQRVAVARALAGNPRILLADEPTGSLDSKNGQIVLELLQRLNEEGSTIVMVTHEERYNAYASRVIHLLDGCMTSAPAVVA